MKRVVAICGTRPEAVKMAPIVARLREDRDIDVRLIATGQHREIASEVFDAFGLTPDEDLDILTHGQPLATLTARALAGLAESFERTAPDLVLVQGDTTTTFAAALAAFYARVPVAHVEAGLRTGDISQPFPEEANRRLVSPLASLHLAPTPWARGNLVAEGIASRSIVVTGNTVVDALQAFLRKPFSPRTAGVREALDGRRLVVVTTHRRENWGAPQRRIARAVRRAAGTFPDTVFLVPVHPNPLVRESLEGPLSGLGNVILTEPLPYAEMVHVLSRAWVALTDSGGIQEEGCALGVPVLVLRDVTERPEGIDAGVMRLVGSSEGRIVEDLGRLLGDPSAREAMARGTSVFGDGRAAERSRAAIRTALGLAAVKVDEFAPRGLEEAEEAGAWLASSEL